MKSLPTVPFLLLLAGPLSAQGFSVERAPEWDVLFDRQSGWTGADGIYSIPLDQMESPAGYWATNTLLLFSDTFVGDVNAQGARQSGTTLINNSLGLLPAGPPDRETVRFYYGQDQPAQPSAVFVPATPSAQPDEWYWLKDGIRLEGGTYLFAARFRPDPVEFFVRTGLARITLPPGSQPPFANHLQEELPWWLPSQGSLGPIVFGAAFFANTARAGAPSPDGYVYCYGTREDPSKKLLVGRVKEEDFLDTGAWRFWDGQAWVPDFRDAAPISDHVSNELSVVPLPNGQLGLVFQYDSVTRRTVLRVGSRPQGPFFGPEQTLWECKEPWQLPGVYCYNAKAHPHLSDPGTLLISYNVNTLTFLDHFRYADIYRPRFVKVRWN